MVQEQGGCHYKGIMEEQSGWWSDTVGKGLYEIPLHSLVQFFRLDILF